MSSTTIHVSPPDEKVLERGVSCAELPFSAHPYRETSRVENLPRVARSVQSVHLGVGLVVTRQRVKELLHELLL